MGNTIIKIFAAVMISAAALWAAPTYLILYDDDPGMLTQVNRLKSLRQSQGFQVVMESRANIYNAYPSLSWQWKVKQYIADVAGNASYDLQYVVIVSADDETWPAHYTDYIFLPRDYDNDYDILSDDWYVDTEGDDWVPDIAVGRIPFSNATLLSYYIDKLITYESHYGENWKNKIMVSIENKTNNPLQLYGGMTVEEYYDWLYNWSSDIQDRIPTRYTVDEIRASTYYPNHYVEYRNRINNGRSFTLHLGSATDSSIGGEANGFAVAYTNTQHPQYERSVAHFNNGPKFPFFYVPACFAGVLGDNIPVIARVFSYIVGKGGIGVFAPTDSIDFLHESKPFTVYFLEHLLRGNDRRIGQIVKNAKKAIAEIGGPGASATPYLELSCDPALILNLGDDWYPKLLPGFPVRLSNVGGLGVGNLYPPLAEGLPSENPPAYYPSDAPQDIITTTEFATCSFDDTGKANFYRYIITYGEIPAIADINSDGLFEIIVIHGDKILAYNNEGGTLNGFPSTLGEPSYFPPAFGDVNSDGYLDIVVATENKVRVINHDGS
jgi:hypothetical protein